MRIALISYEMPPATGGGGIGTYLTNLIPMLAGAGHDIEVFAGAGAEMDGTVEAYGAPLHRFGRNVPEFLSQLATQVSKRHAVRPFDVAEAPEYFAQAAPIQQAIPGLPTIVKLHTPTFVIDQLNFAPYSLSQRLRWILGAFRRLQWPQPIPSLPKYDAVSDIEAITTLKADQISPPTRAIWTLLNPDWNMPSSRRFDVALPFRPNPQLLSLPIDRHSKTILFLGRLEGRKGIVELVNVLPRVLATRPEVRVRFVGSPHPAPDGHGNFSDWVRRQLTRFEAQIELPGACRPEQLPEVFGAADIAVFPSRWENHPYVCLEAMAAGCGVVGSRHGGMAELLDGGNCGVLVDPRSNDELAVGLETLLDAPAERQRLGTAARARILSNYAPEALLSRYEEGYRLAASPASDLSGERKPVRGNHASSFAVGRSADRQ